MDRSYVQPLAQKPFTVFRIGGRRADEQQLCAGAAPAERYQVKDLSPSVSLEQRVKLAGVFTCVCLQPTSSSLFLLPVCLPSARSSCLLYTSGSYSGSLYNSETDQLPSSSR